MIRLTTSPNIIICNILFYTFTITFTPVMLKLAVEGQKYSLVEGLRTDLPTDLPM